MGLVENVENEGGSPGFGDALFTTSAVGAPLVFSRSVESTRNSS